MCAGYGCLSAEKISLVFSRVLVLALFPRYHVRSYLSPPQMFLPTGEQAGRVPGTAWLELFGRFSRTPAGNQPGFCYTIYDCRVPSSPGRHVTAAKAEKQLWQLSSYIFIHIHTYCDAPSAGHDGLLSTLCKLGELGEAFLIGNRHVSQYLAVQIYA